MTHPQYFSDLRRLAYDQTSGNGPGIVFLGGFNSDKNGTKALFLEDWARRHGRAFLRFDYSGHGQSRGAVTDFTLGDWIDDAAAIITGLTHGPQVLVGSSMGGWIALVLAQRMPEKIAGMVTVAAAPDFTERHYMAKFSQDDRDQLEQTGQIAVATKYSESPYIITKRLIEEARAHLLLTGPIALPFPVRFLMGTADEAVSVETALQLLDCADGPDIRLTLVKDADHRFSDSQCLALIQNAVVSVTA